MGSIRSFDGRNCEWLIKYTRAVSGPYVPYSVGTPWPAYIKVVAVKPLFSRHAASARRSEGEICTRSTRDKVVKSHIGENPIGRFFGNGRYWRKSYWQVFRKRSFHAFHTPPYPRRPGGTVARGTTG